MALDTNTPKLGFGLMRLPRRASGIDLTLTKQMVDAFMDAGFTYFDTAYVYLGSESAARRALVERYPRDSFTLASKLYASAAPTAKAARKELETSLKRTGAGYFDYYLLHSVNSGNHRKYEKLGLWDYVQEKKTEGLIRHIGFSFHAGPELLDEILTQHPEVEFVQLQVNYADWENKRVQSRANYEVARKHGVSVVVMEPLKGGKIANPPQEVRDIFDAAGSGASYASWGIRFAASLDGVLTVLSGMSTLEQVRDNVSYMRDFKPLDVGEQKIIQKAQAAFNASSIIQCTACGYCLEGCPRQIPIPQVFEAMNMRLGSGQIEGAGEAYAAAVADKGKASDCVACGACERTCTQNLDIIGLLKECAEALEKR